MLTKQSQVIPKKQSRENLVTAFIFLAGVAFFSLASVYFCLQTTETVASLEKRTLAEFPPLQSFRKNAQKFLAAFESFYNDRFAFRLPLISEHNLIAYTVFGASGSSRVLVGKHGFLFSNDPYHAETALNSLPFSDDGLKLWARSLQAKRDYLARNGIQYLLILLPEKSCIYSENLPAGWHRRPGPSRLDRLQSYLKAHTDVDFVDAKSILLSHKNESTPLFLRNDTHWNCLGSFFVAQSALSHLQQHFPNVEPFRPSECKLMEYQKQGGDLADQLALPTFFNEENYVMHLNDQRARLDPTVKLPVIQVRQREPQAFVVADQRLPRGLLLGDSFMSALAPYLADRMRFSEIHWAHDFSPDLLVSQKPEVVIEEIVERHLLDYPPDCIATLIKRSNAQPETAPTTARSASSETSLAVVSQVLPRKVPQGISKGVARRAAETSPDTTQEAAREAAREAPREAAPGATLATFGQSFELKDLSARRHENTLTLKLLWRSKVSQKLDGSVNLWLLSDKNKPLCEFDFWLDRYKKEVQAGDEFVTTVEIPANELENATRIAMVTIPWQKFALPVIAKNSDMGNYRLLLPLHEAEAREEVNDRFVADSGSNIAL
jgi:alginate O-acetyltransferase complex protein AlgJ